MLVIDLQSQLSPLSYRPFRYSASRPLHLSPKARQTDDGGSFRLVCSIGRSIGIGTRRTLGLAKTVANVAVCKNIARTCRTVTQLLP
jgi:hypothetical protein